LRSKVGKGKKVEVMRVKQMFCLGKGGNEAMSFVQSRQNHVDLCMKKNDMEGSYGEENVDVAMSQWQMVLESSTCPGRCCGRYC